MEQDILARLKQKIAVYQPSEETKQIVRATSKLFMVGVSGAGKGTVGRELMHSGLYHRIVTSTTRQPRSNNGHVEQDGVEYHFIDLKRADQMLDTGEYVEANIYGDNIYGASVAEFQAAHRAGLVAIGDVEVQGVDSYRRIDPKRTSAVFIVPPSYDVWQERLLGRYRGTIDQADYQRRMAIARHELVHVLSSPYYYFVINDVLTATVAEIADITTSGIHTEARQEAGRHATEHLLAQLDLSLPR